MSLPGELGPIVNDQRLLDEGTDPGDESLVLGVDEVGVARRLAGEGQCERVTMALIEPFGD